MVSNKPGPPTPRLVPTRHPAMTAFLLSIKPKSCPGRPSTPIAACYSFTSIVSGSITASLCAVELLCLSRRPTVHGVSPIFRRGWIPLPEQGSPFGDREFSEARRIPGRSSENHMKDEVLMDCLSISQARVGVDRFCGFATQ